LSYPKGRNREHVSPPKPNARREECDRQQAQKTDRIPQKGERNGPDSVHDESRCDDRRTDLDADQRGRD